VVETAFGKEVAKSVVWGARSLQRKATRSNPQIVDAYNAANNIKRLHLGCGYRVIDGWLNADLRPRTDEVLQFDATKTFPLPDNHFDFVYSEHMIEHIPYAAGMSMVAECFRVLRPGGRLRLATPDLQFLLDLKTDKPSELQQRYIDWSCNTFLPEVTKPSAAFAINAFVRNWGHTFIYDKETLAETLAGAGFTDVVHHKINESSNPELADLESGDRMPDGFLELESQLIEAVKP